MAEGNETRPADSDMESIRAHAAKAAFEDPPPPNPHPVGSKQWKVWSDHFDGVMAARFGG
jgi:hypothetical protein